MVGRLGGPLRRAPGRASEAEAGDGEGAPDAALVHEASRHHLLAIRTPVLQFKRKIEWPVETTSKPPSLSRFRRPPPRGEESPSQVSTTPSSAAHRMHRGKTARGGSVQRKLTKSTSGGARGLGLRSGHSVAARGLPDTVVDSVEVPHYELREDPSFWMENNVQVVIRVRPLNNTEKNLHGYKRCLRQESAQSITWIRDQENCCFTFDHVACESVNQEVLFQVAGLPMVENCMAGYNGCVFSYGQTGSGKTHTMLGEISELRVKPGPECGMIPRIFELLITRIRAEEESRRDEKLKYNCKCSFLEIYNEQITDLLDPSSTNLPLREDTVVGAYVENLTKREVTCVGDIITLLMQSSVNRKVSATNMNSASSRSHTVFTCTIESRWEKDSICNSRVARLNLVDLAGSERQTASGAEGERLKEASNINKSLSTLSHVIMSVVDRTCGKKRHVPYRDSKLTFLLQDSLGGNSKTLIIANISPSLCSSDETLSTLKFAQRARRIQNNAIVNEDSLGNVQALQHQICVLKEELAVIKGQHALQTHRALEAEEQCNADVVCHQCKERETADNELQMLRSQLTKLLQEKENVMQCHLKCHKTIEDLSSEVFQLKSEIIDKEKCNEAFLKELEIKMQEKDSDAEASLILWHKEKEALQLEVLDAKSLADQKSAEASILRAKFQDAHATIANAESTMVKALMEANENVELQAEKYKQKESSFIIEKDDLLSEISSLKMLLDVKEQNYQDMEKNFESSHLESNVVALELEDGIKHLKNLLSENHEIVSSGVEWMKSKLRQFAELARTWLEDIWLETIGKDCAISVLHLCHMGILLEIITGLHAENGFLQCGISESNSLISTLREHNDKAKNELKMCGVLKGKLLLDINHSFGLIAKKEQEATELSSRLDSFGKKILHLQAQEEAMLAKSDSIYSEISVLTREIDGTNRSSLAAESKEKEDLRHQLDEALLLNGMLKDAILEVLSLPEVDSAITANDMKECNEFKLCRLLVNYHHELVMINTIANDIESNVLTSQMEQYRVQLQKQILMFSEVLEGLKKESTLWKVDQDLGSVAIHTLHDENSNVRIDLKNLKQSKDVVMKSLQANDQADQRIELTETIKSLEHEVACKSHDLDILVSGRQLLEAQIMKGNEKISVLEERLANTDGKINAVSMENSELRSQLNHIEQISYSLKEELACKSNATERMEERLMELRNLLDERSSFLQNLQNDFSKLSDEKECCVSQVLILRDKLDRSQAVAEESEAIATEAQQMADEMKAYAEEKDEEVRLLERSIDDLESTVCALEEQLASKVGELNAVSIAKHEEGTEPSSISDSFGKSIMHLQRQEEAMLARSNPMHSELFVLTEEIDAINRSALAAESNENEELRRQLDEALLLNGMLKDRMLEDLSLLQVNNAIAVNDMNGCNEFQSCNLLANYHHESVMINAIAMDTETTVLASELKQHKLELQEQMLMCTEVVEGLKTEAILWKVDQELGGAIIDELLEENNSIRTDFENLKRNNERSMAKMERFYATTSRMCSLSRRIQSLVTRNQGFSHRPVEP